MTRTVGSSDGPTAGWGGMCALAVLLVVLFSVIVLGETVTARTWLGSVLIVSGLVLLMAPK